MLSAKEEAIKTLRMVLMKRISVFIIIVFLSAFLLPAANAGEIESASNKFSVSDSVIAYNRTEGDFIALGNTVKLEAGVGGDIIAFGMDVKVTDKEEVHNIFAAGQKVRINVAKASNIYALGSTVSVGSEYGISGAYLAGETVQFIGDAREVYLAAVEVILDGNISQNVVIYSDNITFGNNIKIGGNIDIYCTEKPSIPAFIDESKVTFHIVDAAGARERFNAREMIVLILGILSALLIAVLLTLFMDKFIAKNTAVFRKRAVWQILYGLIAFIVVPIAAIILMIGVIPIPVSVISLIMYGIFLYLSPVITGAILGRYFLKNVNRYLSAMAGVAVIKILLLLPYFGTLLYLACVFFTLGAIVTSIKPNENERESV